MLYSKFDRTRIKKEKTDPEYSIESYRSEFRRDYARLVHSPSFRRLQGKTQLYPGKESDFFRNRLTHSIEVTQIAKSIALKINSLCEDKKIKDFVLDTDLIEFAGLTHDLGHPPFGHQGEEALDECMRDNGGFEGNAQTLRLITKIEKKIFDENHPIGIKDGKDVRVGLNLCARTIASVLKYDNIIGVSKEERIVYAGGNEDDIKPVKGYYKNEEDLIRWVKQQVLNGIPLKKDQKFKTIECQIMDIADDIAYSTYDLEDSLKAGFVKPFDYLFPKKEILDKVSAKVSKTLNDDTIDNDKVIETLILIFSSVINVNKISGVKINNENFKDYHLMLTGGSYDTANELSNNGFLRNEFTSGLVGRFIRGITFKLNKDILVLSKVDLIPEIRLQVEILKTFNYHMQIESPRLKVVEFRGKEIVSKIFKTLKDKKGYELLPSDYKDLYLNADETLKDRVICDFISGMTDLYAVEFYGRLTSENPETIFKPY